VILEDYAHHFSDVALQRLKTPLALELVRLVQPKVKLMKEMAEQLVPLCTPGAVEVDASGLKWNKDNNLKVATQAAVKHALDLLGQKMSNARSDRSTENQAWGGAPTLADAGMQSSDIDSFLRQIGEQHGVKLGDLTQPMRLTVTGRMVSVGLFDLLPHLPWDLVEARLRKVQEI